MPKTLEQYKNSHQAKTKLAELALADGAVKGWKNSETEVMRNAFAKQYRKWIGIPPEAHEIYRQKLEAVAVDGSETVESIREQLRQQFRFNGGFEIHVGM